MQNNFLVLMYYMYIMCTCCFSHTIYIIQGCLPRAFVPATSIDKQVEVDCSLAHPSLRGMMRWKCVSNITWEGDLSECTFTTNAVHSLVILSYLLCAGTSEVQLELEMIQEDVGILLHLNTHTLLAYCTYITLCND